MDKAKKSFDTGEVVLNYFEGPKSGPSLLILHGLSARYQMNMPLSVPLMSKWHVFACDFRGHGKSGKVPGYYRLMDYGRDIVTFLHENFAEPVVLMGTSLGAITSLEIASQIPDRVRALLLIEPPLYLRNKPAEACVAISGFFQFLYSIKKECSSFDDIVKAVRASQPPDADEGFIQEVSSEFDQLDVETIATFLQNQLLEGWSLENVFPKIKVPTLLLYGDWEHGGVVREEDAEHFKANLPQATCIKIVDGSHFFPWERTEMTVEHIQNFLQYV